MFQSFAMLKISLSFSRPRQQSELEVIPSVVVDESGQNDDWLQDSSESEEEPTVVENLKASKA
jgi:hypothetical protein